MVRGKDRGRMSNLLHSCVPVCFSSCESFATQVLIDKNNKNALG